MKRYYFALENMGDHVEFRTALLPSRKAVCDAIRLTENTEAWVIGSCGYDELNAKQADREARG